MAKKQTTKKKSASTEAGEMVREEIHHIREGKHGARNTKQAIAIGLSKARRAGVAVKAPRKGTASKAMRKKAEQDTKKGRAAHKTSPKRSAAAKKALKREPRKAASHAALSKHAKKVAATRKRSS
ncbi:MAG: hypothetical protein M3N54_15170 [Acidobacteriota bacterium]|nr:hypothetical protein [Acidobacteriota bacterium]